MGAEVEACVERFILIADLFAPLQDAVDRGAQHRRANRILTQLASS